MPTKREILETETMLQRLTETLARHSVEPHNPTLIAREDAEKLRRIAMTLQRWFELECGDGNGMIEREEKTGAPYWYNANSRFVGAGDRRAYRRIPDRETGARKRLAAIMARYPTLRAYVQTDPRGAALYILRPDDVRDCKSVDDLASRYTRGICVHR